MASATADAGYVTDATLARYRHRVQAEAGIVTVEYSYVHASGRSEPQQLGAADDAMVPGLTSLASTICASGALPALQLVHAGGKTTPTEAGTLPMAPSAVAVPHHAEVLPVPRAMTASDIEAWHAWFVAAAGRALAAGFAMVELHAAHGYGLNQWLSPYTNRRDDAYGGSLTGRTRLLREIIETVRHQWPALLISVRLPGQDYIDGGLTPGCTRELAMMLIASGVDLLSISSGLGGWRRLRPGDDEGYLVDDAARLHGLGAPIVGVGGIRSRRYIDEALALARLDFAAVGRALEAAPTTWRCQVGRDAGVAVACD